jgi:hypothetical protein
MLVFVQSGHTGTGYFRGGPRAAAAPQPGGRSGCAVRPKLRRLLGFTSLHLTTTRQTRPTDSGTGINRSPERPKNGWAMPRSRRFGTKEEKSNTNKQTRKKGSLLFTKLHSSLRKRSFCGGSDKQCGDSDCFQVRNRTRSPPIYVPTCWKPKV